MSTWNGTPNSLARIPSQWQVYKAAASWRQKRQLCVLKQQFCVHTHLYCYASYCAHKDYTLKPARVCTGRHYWFASWGEPQCLPYLPPDLSASAVTHQPYSIHALPHSGKFMLNNSLFPKTEVNERQSCWFKIETTSHFREFIESHNVLPSRTVKFVWEH